MRMCALPFTAGPKVKCISSSAENDQLGCMQPRSTGGQSSPGSIAVQSATAAILGSSSQARKVATSHALEV